MVGHAGVRIGGATRGDSVIVIASVCRVIDWVTCINEKQIDSLNISYAKSHFNINCESDHQLTLALPQELQPADNQLLFPVPTFE